MVVVVVVLQDMENDEAVIRTGSVMWTNWSSGWWGTVYDMQHTGIHEAVSEQCNDICKLAVLPEIVV